MAKRPYTKPALSPADLLAHLQSRGLIVPDSIRALHALEYIGYYRLLIYMRPLQSSPAKTFLSGTTFEDILSLYNFDRELRLLCLDAIERIEVALRSAIVSQVAVPHGSHFFLDASHFERLTAFVEFLHTVNKTKHYLAIQHYHKHYTTPEMAPIWAITEAITFGTLSRLYSGLHLRHRKEIAKRFALDETVLVSWFRTLATLRNMCAHHNRLWNATLLVDAPKVAHRYRVDLTPNDQFYSRAVILAVFMAVVDPTSHWPQRLVHLMDRHPKVQPGAMGFPAGWRTRDLWT